MQDPYKAQSQVNHYLSYVMETFAYLQYFDFQVKKITKNPKN